MLVSVTTHCPLALDLDIVATEGVNPYTTKCKSPFIIDLSDTDRQLIKYSKAFSNSEFPGESQSIRCGPMGGTGLW